MADYLEEGASCARSLNNRGPLRESDAKLAKTVDDKRFGAIRPVGRAPRNPLVRAF